MTGTVREALTRQDNNYDPYINEVLRRTGMPLGWHDITPPAAAALTPLSVVIAARNVRYCLTDVLDALTLQRTAGQVQVVVVDDASTDATSTLAAAHPAPDIVVRLPQRVGSGAARNVGTLLAAAETVLYLDADMVLPHHVLADVAARAHERLALIGFRHNTQCLPAGRGRTVVPAGEPSLDADHRVIWRPPVGKPLFYSGVTLDEPIEGRPLDDTDDLRDLGHGRRYRSDWDLPRMFVTALAAAPRQAVIDIGGFHPAFAAGWGCDDTYLGALLIAAGIKIAPLRQARGWHIDPPEADAAWQAKYATAADNVARYWALLDQPAGCRPPLTDCSTTVEMLNAGERLK